MTRLRVSAQRRYAFGACHQFPRLADDILGRTAALTFSDPVAGSAKVRILVSGNCLIPSRLHSRQ